MVLGGEKLQEVDPSCIVKQVIGNPMTDDSHI
jgi:hypothetical protein